MDRIIEFILGFILITLIALVVLVWPVMLLFGALASILGIPALAISFKATIVVVLIARLCTSSASVS